MMNPDQPKPIFPVSAFDGALLDLHLGRLAEPERAALLHRIQSDPDLAAQHDALSRMFAALESLRAQTPPADLAARTMARVKAAQPPLRGAAATRRAAAVGRP